MLTRRGLGGSPQIATLDPGRGTAARAFALNETIKQALRDAVDRRRSDPEFKVRLRRIIEEDRELLERLAK